jgi:hypothetical protein
LVEDSLPNQLMSEVLTKHTGVKAGLTETVLGDGKSCTGSDRKSCAVPGVDQKVLVSFVGRLGTHMCSK